MEEKGEKDTFCGTCVSNCSPLMVSFPSDKSKIFSNGSEWLLRGRYPLVKSKIFNGSEWLLGGLFAMRKAKRKGFKAKAERKILHRNEERAQWW